MASTKELMNQARLELCEYLANEHFVNKNTDELDTICAYIVLRERQIRSTLINPEFKQGRFRNYVTPDLLISVKIEDSGNHRIEVFDDETFSFIADRVYIKDPNQPWLRGEFVNQDCHVTIPRKTTSFDTLL